MNMKILTVISCAGLVLAGCRTTKDVLDDYEANISNGRYREAGQEVYELSQETDGDQLMWRLLSASAASMAGDTERAIAQFDLAEDSFADYDRTSVFARGGEGAMAMLMNDKSFSYDGGGGDRVFTCLYKAIDYTVRGEMDAARTELNRAAQYQENWIWARRKDIAAAEERMEKDAAEKESADSTGVTNRDSHVSTVLNDRDFCRKVEEQCDFNPFTSGNLDELTAKDYVNPYVQHVTGVFRWLNGDPGARDMLREAAELSGNPVAAQDLAEIEKGNRPSGQVWIYAEDGLCPCREEWRVDLPFVLIPVLHRYVLYAGMALPYLRPRPFGARNWRVSAGGTMVPMTPLADVDKLVKTEYDVYMRGALKREVTRTIVKAGAQVALGIAAENSGDWKHQLSLRGAQVTAAAWAAATTAADLRVWSSLPKGVRLTRVARPADGKIVVTADAQRIELEIPEGNAMVFLRKPGPVAVPSVKIARFK